VLWVMTVLLSLIIFGSSGVSAQRGGLFDGPIPLGFSNPIERKASMPPDTDRGPAVLCVRDQDPQQRSFLWIIGGLRQWLAAVSPSGNEHEVYVAWLGSTL
jgi:hypothetical protein